MKKFFSGKHGWQVLSTWMFTLILLAGGFGTYFYVYVEARQRYHTEKKLRELRLLGDRLKLRIENIANHVFPNAVSASMNPETYQVPPCDGVKPDADMTVQLNGVPSITPEKAACDFRAILQMTQLVPNFTLEKSIEYDSVKTSPGGKAQSALFPLVSLTVRTEGEIPALLFTFRGRVKREEYSVKLRALIPVRDLFGQFGTDSSDHLVVADKNGRVQFEMGERRLAVHDLASLVESRTRGEKSEKEVKSDTTGEPPERPAWNSLSSSTNVSTLKLAGEDYLLFLQPVKLSLIGGDADEGFGVTNPRTYDWRIAGLIHKDRFAHESYAVSYTAVLIFLFVLFVLVFAEPFLKIASLGPLDHLRRRDVILLCFSAVLTLALVTFFALDLYTYSQLEAQLDTQLTRLANKVQDRLNEDLDDLLGVLQEVSHEPIPEVSDEPKPEEQRVKLLVNAAASLRDRLIAGAFFDMVAWVDSKGVQKFKWTTQNRITPLVRVDQRPYFQRVRENRLWKKDGQEVRFWLGPVESWNTGENLAMVSVLGPPAKSSNPAPTGFGSGDNWVITLDVELPSLRNVVLPLGFGFVVMEENGTVLFHSDPARHFRENFFEECDDEPVLRAAVFGRVPEILDAGYLGTDHRLLVKPLPTPPWTLVVYRDKKFLRTANLEILTLSLVLFLFMSLFLLPGLFFLWFRDTGWLWLDEGRRVFYPQYLLGALATVLLFLFAIFFFAPPSLAYAAFLIPFAVLLVTYFKFEPRPDAWAWRLVPTSALPLFAAVVLLFASWVERKHWEAAFLTLLLVFVALLIFHPRTQEHLKKPERAAKLPETRACYRFSVALLLILLGVLPAMAFFRIAYENEMTLFLKHGQFRLGQAINARKDRLYNKYRKLQGGEALFEARLQKKLSRDVYQEFFFPCSATGAAQLRDRPAVRPLNSLLETIRPFYNQPAIESHMLTYDLAGDRSHRWLWDDANCLTLESGSLAPPNIQPVVVQLPSWWEPLFVKWVGVAGLLIVGLFSFVWYITLFVTERVFLLNLKAPREVPEPPSPDSFAATWERCSRQEKIALYDIAADGFLNYRNPAIPALFEEGLVRQPPLRLASEDFQKFVKEKGAKENVYAPGADEQPSAWQIMKWPLVVALLGLATFLFFSQRHVFEVSVGFLGALGGGIAALSKLWRLIRGSPPDE